MEDRLETGALGPLESAADETLVFDLSGNLVAANASACRSLGCTLAELLGRRAGDLCTHLEPSAFERSVEALRAGDFPQRSGHLRRRDGTLLAVETRLWLARPRGEERVFTLSRAVRGTSDPSEERRSRLLCLTEVSRSVATSLLERDDLNQAIFLVLSGVSRALGATRSFLYRYREDRQWLFRTHEWTAGGGPVHRLQTPPEPAERFRRATEVLLRGEALRISDPAACPAEWRGLLEPMDRALLALPVHIRGRLEGCFGFADSERASGTRSWDDEEVASVQIIVDSFARGVERTIAEREKRRVLRDLEQSVERERAASHYKSEFLASMSHELRTPMNAIRGYAELLGRPKVERAVQETWIANLRRSSEYLLGLIHDVLDLSKIEAGHMRLEREVSSLAEILSGVEELLAGAAREKGLEFRVQLEGEVPERFETDAVRLKQILVNLVGNAIKFTNTGSVVLRARTVGGASEGQALRLAVEDTGIGIPPAARDQLFRPFSQVHERVQGPGGTGLGLQISRSLARLLGGDISVESEVGRGSTFTVELPLQGASGVLRGLPERRSASSPEARALPRALSGARILVVDDSAENREVLCFLLQEAGASCATASDGAAGVEQALAAERARAPFDAILMDMNMPVLDGFEATRSLLRAGTTSPVIALTALALAGDEERCREAGCVDYVSKPIVPSLFFETLARHVRGRRAAPAGRPEGGEGALFALAQHPRFHGLVERYVASFPELSGRLRALMTAGRLEEVRTLVHRLRGTAASYGFPGVAQAAGRCEDALRGGAPPEELPLLLEDLLARLSLAAAG